MCESDVCMTCVLSISEQQEWGRLFHNERPAWAKLLFMYSVFARGNLMFSSFLLKLYRLPSSLHWIFLSGILVHPHSQLYTWGSPCPLFFAVTSCPSQEFSILTLTLLHNWLMRSLSVLYLLRSTGDAAKLIWSMNRDCEKDIHTLVMWRVMANCNADRKWVWFTQTAVRARCFRTAVVWTVIYGEQNCSKYFMHDTTCISILNRNDS